MMVGVISTVVAAAVVLDKGFQRGSKSSSTINVAQDPGWGDASAGQLGYGRYNKIGDDANEMGDNLLAVSSLAIFTVIRL